MPHWRGRTPQEISCKKSLIHDMGSLQRAGELVLTASAGTMITNPVRATSVSPTLPWTEKAGGLHPRPNGRGPGPGASEMLAFPTSCSPRGSSKSCRNTSPTCPRRGPEMGDRRAGLPPEDRLAELRHTPPSTTTPSRRTRSPAARARRTKTTSSSSTSSSARGTSTSERRASRPRRSASSSRT